MGASAPIGHRLGRCGDAEAREPGEGPLHNLVMPLHLISLLLVGAFEDLHRDGPAGASRRVSAARQAGAPLVRRGYSIGHGTPAV